MIGPSLAPSLLAFGIAAAGIVALVRTDPAEIELATYSTPLANRTPSQKHNAELALERLKGTVIPPGAEFSFNKTVGTWTRDQGYRKAPVSYNGQLIDSWGGGVCQASTTLYNTALLSGMEILERHRHRFAPGYVPPGRDAAVAFSDIDLRFRNPLSHPVKIEGKIEHGRIFLTMTSRGMRHSIIQVQEEIRQTVSAGEFHITGGETKRTRIRNSGKDGFDVLVWRMVGGNKELVSSDHYPPMNRIIQDP